MKRYLTKFLFPLLLIFFLIPLSIWAVRLENPLEADNLWELINKLIDFIFTISLGIVPIMIIIAGFYFITAAGDLEKINTAKKMILWTLIGLIIVFCAKGVIKLFKEIFEIEQEEEYEFTNISGEEEEISIPFIPC